MTKKKSAAGDYEVGYGKPPKLTRFKLGQSGNPKGRPKGSKDFRSLLHRALFKKVRVTEDGQIRTMSRVEAVVTRLVAKELNGDVRAAESVVRLVQQHFPAGEESRKCKYFLQRFSDGEILGEKTLQIGDRGRVSSRSKDDPWGYLSNEAPGATKATPEDRRKRHRRRCAAAKGMKLAAAPTRTIDWPFCRRRRACA